MDLFAAIVLLTALAAGVALAIPAIRKRRWKRAVFIVGAWIAALTLIYYGLVICLVSAT